MGIEEEVRQHLGTAVLQFYPLCNHKREAQVAAFMYLFNKMKLLELLGLFLREFSEKLILTQEKYSPKSSTALMLDQHSFLESQSDLS